MDGIKLPATAIIWICFTIIMVASGISDNTLVTIVVAGVALLSTLFVWESGSKGISSGSRELTEGLSKPKRGNLDRMLDNLSDDELQRLDDLLASRRSLDEDDQILLNRARSLEDKNQ